MNINNTPFKAGGFDISTNQQIGNQSLSTTDTLKNSMTLLSNLKQGQIFDSQILDVRNDVVSLLFKQQVVEAKFEGSINFNIGETVSFIVKDNTNNQLILSPYTQAVSSSMESALYKALEYAELPATDKNIDLISLLLENNMSVDKHTIHQFMTHMVKYPQTSIETFVLMTKYNINITQDNIKQWENYNTYQHQLSKDIANIADMLPDILNKIFENTGRSDINNLFEQLFTSSNNSIINQVIHQNNDSDKSTNELKQLLQKDEFIRTIRNELLKTWTFQPDQINSSKIADKYEKIELQVNTLLSHIKDNTQASEALHSLKNVKDNINYMKQVNQNFIYAQLPMQFKNQVTHGELYVYAKRKSRPNAKDGIHLLLHLDMEHLGQTNISINIKQNYLTIQFSLDNKKAYEILDQHLSMLNTNLENKGYHVTSKLSLEENGFIDFKNDFLAQGESAPLITHYSFDRRV